MGSVFILDEKKNVHKLPPKLVQPITNQFIVLNLIENEYLAFPSEDDFRLFLGQQDPQLFPVQHQHFLSIPNRSEGTGKAPYPIGFRRKIDESIAT